MSKTNPLGVSDEKLRRLNARLTAGGNRSDRGQLLAQTRAALEITDREERLRELVSALSVERLIVPAAIEISNHEVIGENQTETSTPLVLTETPAGTSVVAFTSQKQLATWDVEARPITMPSKKVSLTSLAIGVRSIWIDPCGASILVPRGAVEALAYGGKWLPPWCDRELQEELSSFAANFGNIKVELGPSVANESDWWDAGLKVIVSFESETLKGLDSRVFVESVLNELAKSKRLQVSSESVQFIPRVLQ